MIYCDIYRFTKCDHSVPSIVVNVKYWWSDTKLILREYISQGHPSETFPLRKSENQFWGTRSVIYTIYSKHSLQYYYIGTGAVI